MNLIEFDINLVTVGDLERLNEILEGNFTILYENDRIIINV